MLWNEAVLVLERYYNQMYSWESDSNCGGYDSDVALTKDKLEVLIYYLQMGYLASAHVYMDFLSELKEDIGEQNVLEAIDCIIEVINKAE